MYSSFAPIMVPGSMGVYGLLGVCLALSSGKSAGAGSILKSSKLNSKERFWVMLV